MRAVGLALLAVVGCSGQGGASPVGSIGDMGDGMVTPEAFRICASDERVELIYHGEHAAWRWQRATGAAIAYSCDDPNVWVEPAAIGDEPQWDEADGMIVLRVDPDVARPDLAVLHGLGHVLAGDEAHSASGVMAADPVDLIDSASLTVVCLGRARCIRMTAESPRN